MPISRIETASLDSALVAPTATALTTASGSAPSYSARAWVNFNGTGTVAIRGSGNVTSITDNGTGDYTVNFTTAMPDANYAPSITSWSSSDAWGYIPQIKASATPTTTAMRVYIIAQQGATTTISDIQGVNVAIFR